MNLQFLPRTQRTVFLLHIPAGYYCLRAQNRWLFWESYVTHKHDYALWTNAESGMLKLIIYRVYPKYLGKFQQWFLHIEKKILRNLCLKIKNVTVWYFTHNWCNTFTVFFRSLIKVEVLLSTKSQFTKYCSKFTPAGLLHILTLLIVDCRTLSTVTRRLQMGKCIGEIAYDFKLEQNGVCKI